MKLAADAGRFGGALHFPKKGTTRPSFKDGGVLGYNAKSWSCTVSVWLRLDPDKDLEPGYCDPVQIIGDDNKKGYIFCEWSKDETPRYFRYAIRPLFHIWNPDNKPWGDIPFEKRPMVQVDRRPRSRGRSGPTSRSRWRTSTTRRSRRVGKLYLNGKLQGAIEKWDLTFDWDPAKVLLVLGAVLRRAHGRPGRVRPPAHGRRGRVRSTGSRTGSGSCTRRTSDIPHRSEPS